MSELVEVALRDLLSKDARRSRELPPLPAWDGGGLLVDVDDRGSLYELFDRDDPLVQELKSWSRDEGGGGAKGA
jgi:hypothetical protein